MREASKEETSHSELAMRKEFKLTIYAIGEDTTDAIESAVRMLNEGAAFDHVDFERELPQEPPRRVVEQV